MKKNWLHLILAMAFIAMPLTSCDNDDDDVTKPVIDQHDPTSDADQVPVTGYDALEWLQSCIVVVDENSEVVRRIYGKPLDESQPTVLSISVSNFADAEKIFLSWVAPGKEATKVEGGYDYHLTDAKGNDQGSVSLRAVEGEDGVIARMTVAEGTDLKQVSEVKFIHYELWPENAEYPIYRTGEMYLMETKHLYWGRLPQDGRNYLKAQTKEEIFYCIQGNTPGEEGILIWIAPDYNADLTNVPGYAYIDTKATQYLPSEAEAQKVLDVFNKMDKRSWDYMLERMDKLGFQWSAQSGGFTTGDDEFLLNSYRDGGFWGTLIKCLDLDSRPGKITEVMAETSMKYRYMHIIIIPASRWELLI
jgi:hypothetical protein